MHDWQSLISILFNPDGDPGCKTTEANLDNPLLSSRSRTPALSLKHPSCPIRNAINVFFSVPSLWCRAAKQSDAEGALQRLVPTQCTDGQQQHWVGFFLSRVPQTWDAAQRLCLLISLHRPLSPGVSVLLEVIRPTVCCPCQTHGGPDLTVLARQGCAPVPAPSQGDVGRLCKPQ